MSLLLLFGGGGSIDPGPSPPELVRRIKVYGKSSALLTQILTRDISSRLALSETLTGVAGEYFINGINLRIGPVVVEATYDLAPATDPYGVGTYFIIDTSSIDGPDVIAPF